MRRKKKILKRRGGESETDKNRERRNHTERDRKTEIGGQSGTKVRGTPKIDPGHYREGEK